MSNPYDRYPEIDSILRQALEGSRRDRDALLVDRCGRDAALREEIDRLLAQVDSGGTLDPAFRLSSEFLTHSLAHTMIGTSLSHYQITAKLGEGGMGEVYRAADTKLGRDVAIKVLPRGFADDRERVSRFEREAKVLATLNHPNIAQVYGFEEHEGTHFLIMELAEGETLADRIRRGPIPPEEATAIARQVAEALEAAHEQGIVHRDLKPANVNVSAETSVTPIVKVLDFGLAKLMAPRPDSGVDLTNSPTLTQPTAVGMLMGTASYMSPEQARGQEADARSDIWAFGCVLYEMLTGRRAFGGDNVSEILASVLKDEPDYEPLSNFPWAGRLVGRCLSKEPGRRWHHIADVRLELDEPRPDFESPSRSDGRSGLLPWVVLAAGVGVALGVLATKAMTSNAPAGTPTTYAVALDAPLPGSNFALWGISVTISGNGERMAVTGPGPDGDQLWVREADDPTWRPLSNTNGRLPDLSSDGRWIEFRNERRETERVPFEGGASVVVSELASTLLVAQLADDIEVACINYSHLDRQLVLRKNSEHTEALIDNACYPKRVGRRLLFERKHELWAMALGGDELPYGEAVATGIEPFATAYNAPPHYDVSESGTLVYLDKTPDADLWRVDASGRPLERIPTDQAIPGGNPIYLKTSPDGKFVAYSSHREARVVSLSTGRTSRPVSADSVVWLTNDSIVVHEHRGSRVSVLDSQARLLRTVTFHTPNGEVLWGHVNAADAKSDTLVMTMWGDEAETPPVLGPGPAPLEGGALVSLDLKRDGPLQLWWGGTGIERYAALSPDSRWIAWESNSTGRHEINAALWREPAQPIPVSSDGGELVRWSKDGTTLYFVDADRQWVMAADLRPDNNTPFSAPRRVFRLPERTINAKEVAYDTLPNGEFLFGIGRREMRHRLVFNWLADVDRRLATANR